MNATTLPRSNDSPPIGTRGFGAAGLLWRGAQVALVNFVIGVLVATIGGGRYGHIATFSQCIGLSIWAVIELGRRLDPKRSQGWPAGWRGPALVAGGCVLGYAIGVSIADAIFGYSSWRDYLRSPAQLARDFGPTAAFCTIVAGAFWARGQARVQRALAAAAAHEATLARLNLLQSQLEPHMLFNTLANLRALISADPARAQDMLDHLIDFLRATLAASRQAEHPLADEFERIQDYLALMRVRMGERLQARATLAPSLARIPVPPLLLQPLVENAIKHGLEPQRGPGQLQVDAALDGTTLVLTVADSGRGLEAAAAAKAREPLAANPAASGFGIVQIRERLRTLHGDAATLTLSPRPGGGTLAEIRLPAGPQRPPEDPRP